MAESDNKRRESAPAVRPAPAGPSFRLAPLTQDQRQYLSRIREAEQNPDLDIPLGGPRNAPAW
jgi:hypothetical protein